MCGLYLVACAYVLIVNFASIPDLIRLIFTSAFSPVEAQGAFLGGTLGYAFLWGMKRPCSRTRPGRARRPSHILRREPANPCARGSLPAWNRSSIQSSSARSPRSSSCPAEPGTGAPMPCWTLQWLLRQSPVSGLLSRDHCRRPTLAGGAGRFYGPRHRVVNEQTGASLGKLFGVVQESNGAYSVAWTHLHWQQWPQGPSIHTGRRLHRYAGASLTSHAFDRRAAGSRPMARDTRFVALRDLHNDLVELLWRAGRRFHAGRKVGSDLQNPLLPAHSRGYFRVHHDGRGTGCGDRAGEPESCSSPTFRSS